MGKYLRYKKHFKLLSSDFVSGLVEKSMKDPQASCLVKRIDESRTLVSFPPVSSCVVHAFANLLQ